MTLHEEYQELLEAREMLETKKFQKFIAQPMQKHWDELKTAYDCKTLSEIATLKGEAKMCKFFFSLLKNIDSDFRNKRDELDSEGRKL